MLEILRGKTMAFVGDSLNRNMWQALVCSLRESVKNKSGIFEELGRREFRTQRFYSVKFTEFNCSLDFVKSPFLVQEWKESNRTGDRRRTLLLVELEPARERKPRHSSVTTMVIEGEKVWVLRSDVASGWVRYDNHVLSVADYFRRRGFAVNCWGEEEVGH